MHAIDDRVGKPIFRRTENDDALEREAARGFEASDWLRDANALAVRRWNLLVAAHHSFADPFWEKEHERILARRSVLMANSEQHGFPSSSAAEYKSLGILLYHIESAIEEYRGRDLAFSGMVKSLRDGIDRSSTPENRRSRTVEMYLLLGALRNKKIDIDAVLGEMEQLADDATITESRRDQIRRHIGRIGLPFSVPNVVAEDLVPEDAEGDRSTQPTQQSSVVPAEDFTPIRFMPEGGPISRGIEDRGGLEQGVPHDVSEMDEEAGLVRFATAARSIAEREVAGHPELLSVVEIIDGLDGQLSDQIEELSAYARDYPRVHIDVSRYRFTPLEAFVPLLARDVTQIRGQSGISRQSDYMGSSFVEFAKEFLKTRIRYELLRDYVLREGSHTILGVSRGADREAIERAFSSQMQQLDFDRSEDRKGIANLQRARERLLVQAEAREKEEALRRAEERRKREEEAARAHYAWLTKPAEIVPPKNSVPPPRPEGWWSNTLRTPGARIRALFVGAAGLGAVAGAGAIALHEFGESESEPSHIVAGALENISQEGADVDRDKDTEGPGPAVVSPESVLTTDFVVERGDTLWRELKQRIENRGLRVTDQKIFMLKHLADLENPTVDWDRLEVGQVIHLASIERMLDEMEGKPVSAEPAESSTSAPVSESSFASELENIPASTFSEEVARLSQSVDRAEVSGTVKEKAYQGLPTVDHPVREIKKGEHIFKIVHGMLRASGLNWTTERINFLDAVVLEQNHMTEAQAARLPVGTPIDFSEAAKIIAQMKADVAAGKKSKTVKQMKAARAKLK